jgi:hypothetical protein
MTRSGYEAAPGASSSREARPFNRPLALDLAQLGIVLLTGPVVEARVVSGRIELVLNLGVSHGSVILRGKILGDAIRGTWEVTDYMQGATGRFTMVRFVGGDSLDPTRPQTSGAR